MTTNSVSENTSSETTPFRSGFVALVGRPSVGKSTLLNACMGQKVAIASPVAQTTRRRFRAVVNGDNSQLVIVDTPGLHKPKDALVALLSTDRTIEPVVLTRHREGIDE